MGCLGSKVHDVGVDLHPSLLRFEADCLKEHNMLRAMHGCPPLRGHTVLRALAVDWAQHLAETKVMKHRPGNRYGENIFWAQNMPVTGRTAVRSWYNEIIAYNYGKHEYSPETGHFTQIIWRNTKLMGVGVVVKDGIVWIVVNYYPAGNVKEKFAQNVPLRTNKICRYKADIFDIPLGETYTSKDAGKATLKEIFTSQL